MNKLVFIIIIFITIFSDSTKASSWSMILKPVFGLYQPTSPPLKDYYTKNFIFTYGGEVEVLLPVYNLGIFFKIQSYTLDIYESVYERDITESAIWYIGGIMKEIDFEGVSLFSKIGISYHSDELAFIKRENSRWGDWADEYWTIYPDGIAMRSATLQSSGPNSDWIEYQESIFMNQPGTKPSDNIPDAAVTLANLKGETHTYTWKKSFPALFDQPFEPNIQLINFYTKWDQFSVVTPEQIHVQAYPKDRRFEDDEMFNTWDAWPVSQDWSDARKATNFNKVSHSNLTHITWKPYVETPAKRAG